MKKQLKAVLILISAFGMIACADAEEKKKPNILVVWGDDIVTHRTLPRSSTSMNAMSEN